MSSWQLRIWRRIPVAPGLRLNLSKRGIRLHAWTQASL